MMKSIEIKTKPTKTNYYVGETLNTEGLTIEVKYDNETSETIQKGFTCTPTTLTKETKEITVRYEGHIATFPVNVTEKQTDNENDNNNNDNNDNDDNNNNNDNKDDNDNNNSDDFNEDNNDSNNQANKGENNFKGSSTSTSTQTARSAQGSNIATKILPKTGIGATILVGILASSMIAILSWLKIKKYKNI